MAPLLSIRAAWESYRAQVLPPKPSPEQLRQCRWAFYGGAHFVVTQIVRVGAPDVSEDAATRYIQAIIDEADEFARLVGEGRD